MPWTVHKSHFVGVLLHLFALLFLLPAVTTQAWAEPCLDYNETLQSPLLGAAISVTVSPDGANVYVGSYVIPHTLEANLNFPLDYFPGGLFEFKRDLTTGKLTLLPETHYEGVNGVTGIAMPTSIAVSPDGHHAYVTSGGNSSFPGWTGYDAVTLFNRDPTTGALTFVEAKFNGVGGVTGIGGADFVTVSPDGKHVYVAAGRGIKFGDSSEGDNAIAVFQRDAITGKLTFIEAKSQVMRNTGGGEIDVLNGIRSVQVSPDGKHVYAAGEMGVVVFSRNVTTGELSLVEAKPADISFGESTTFPVRGTALVISPDGANVYITSDGFYNPVGGTVSSTTVAVFSRDAVTGMLTRAEVQEFGGSVSMDAAVTPDGAALYIAGFGSADAGAVTLFSRDAGMMGKLQLKGKVRETGTRIHIEGLTSLAMSPDGKNFYGVSFGSHSVAQFDTSPILDPSSGQSTCDGTIASPQTPCDRPENVWMFCHMNTIWYDPPYAFGYDYAIVPGASTPNFRTVTLLNIGDGLFDLYLFDPNQNQFVFAQTIKGLETYDFGPQGVDRFRILGIEPNTVDATDPLGFRTKLSFVSDAPADSMPKFTMEPITPPVTGSECGNGFVEPGEQCDEGSANGTQGSCCANACVFRASGEVCRSAVDASDLAETCTGQSGWCPPDAQVTSVDADHDGFTVSGGDCNDNDPAIHPGAAEICDGIDNDCNGQIDEGVKTTFYRDADGDGFGNTIASIQACTAPAGYVADSTDCNDGDVATHPGATELCNGVDDNCNGQIDEGVQNIFYRDADGDGYGNAATSTQTCSVPTGYVTTSTDCNDTNASIHPGATEICGDGIDQNCDGADAVCPPPPPLAVLIPNSGEVWPINSTQTIRWNPNGVSGNVKIELSRDGGATWTVLFGSTANDGTQDWKVTTPTTSQALMRVSSVKTPSVSDVSNAAFSIGGGAVTVLAPNGGEVWAIGSTQTIQWSTSGFPGNVKIELSRDGGSTWEVLFGSTANDGAQNWKVTTPISNQARIRISSIKDASAVDTSDGVFTLGGGNLTVLAPNGGEVWSIGSLKVIRWSASGIIGNVKIELSRDGGTTWEVLFASTANDGAQSWRVTAPATSQALIRVSGVKDTSVFDSSDALFRVQ